MHGKVKLYGMLYKICYMIFVNFNLLGIFSVLKISNPSDSMYVLDTDEWLSTKYYFNISDKNTEEANISSHCFTNRSFHFSSCQFRGKFVVGLQFELSGILLIFNISL